MNTPARTAETQAAVEELLRRAAELGITADDFQNTTPPAETVATYVARVMPTAGPGHAHTSKTYLTKFAAADQYGTRTLDSITQTDIATFVQYIQRNAVESRGARRNSRGGRSAAENCISALRWLFGRAIGDHLVTSNPALAVAKPVRPRSGRHGLNANQLSELFTVTANGGDDPVLDALLTRFLVETGARREGTINLRLRDIDSERCTVLLREKFDKDGSEQPVCRSTIQALRGLAAARGATSPSDNVFRYKPREGESVGSPLTRRRFNTLADRWQATLPFAAKLGVTPHVLRHTAIGLVESIAGYAVARAFARHHSKREVTTTYLQRDIHDVAHAVEQLTGEAHPLSRDRWEMG